MRGKVNNGLSARIANRGGYSSDVGQIAFHKESARIDRQAMTFRKVVEHRDAMSGID